MITSCFYTCFSFCLQDFLQLGSYPHNFFVLVQIVLARHLSWALLGFLSINAKAACLRRQWHQEPKWGAWKDTDALFRKTVSQDYSQTIANISDHGKQCHPTVNVPLALASPGSCLWALPMLPDCSFAQTLLLPSHTSATVRGKVKGNIDSKLWAYLQSVLFIHTSFLRRTWHWKEFCYFDGVTQGLADTRKNTGTITFQLLKSVGSAALWACYEIT